MIEDLNVDILSPCHNVDLSVIETEKGIQGNLFNALLYADKKTLINEIERILRIAKRFDRYIFNLGHGVFPDVDPNQLKCIVDTVHNFVWR